MLEIADMRGMLRRVEGERQTAQGTFAAALGLGLIACGGGGERQDAALEEADYSIDFVKAEFPRVQRLAKTTHLRLGIENTGAEVIPNLAVTVKLTGEQGENARQAFSYRDPQENLALRDRPIWILDLGYPTLAGGELGGSSTPSPRTFAFGELAPGEVAEAVWQLTPVKVGNYSLTYEASPDLHGVGNLTAVGDTEPIGNFRVRVRQRPEQLRVTGDGRVVPDQPLRDRIRDDSRNAQ